MENYTIELSVSFKKKKMTAKTDLNHLNSLDYAGRFNTLHELLNHCITQMDQELKLPKQLTIEFPEYTS